MLALISIHPCFQFMQDSCPYSCVSQLRESCPYYYVSQLRESCPYSYVSQLRESCSWQWIQIFPSVYQHIAHDWNRTHASCCDNEQSHGFAQFTSCLQIGVSLYCSVLLVAWCWDPSLLKFLGCRLIPVASFIKWSMDPGVSFYMEVLSCVIPSTQYNMCLWLVSSIEMLHFGDKTKSIKPMALLISLWPVFVLTYL
jgi:hypothetical protein